MAPKKLSYKQIQKLGAKKYEAMEKALEKKLKEGFFGVVTVQKPTQEVSMAKQIAVWRQSTNTGYTADVAQGGRVRAKEKGETPVIKVRYHGTMTKEEYVAFLKERAAQIETTLNRIDALMAGPSEEEVAAADAQATEAKVEEAEEVEEEADEGDPDDE